MIDTISPETVHLALNNDFVPEILAMAIKPKKGGLIVLATLVITVLVSGGFLGWRTLSRHSIAMNSIPPRPAANAWPAELESSVNEAENQAQSYLNAKNGLIALSRLYHANGHYNEAMQCYAGLRLMEPSEPRWWHLESCILAGFGRLDEALIFEQTAVALAPKSVPAKLRLGDILLKSNQTDVAAKTYAAVSELESNNPYALLGLAKCGIARGDWNDARVNLRQAIKSHPDFIGGLSLMASVAEHFGDQAEAESLRVVIGRREFSDYPDPWLDGLLDDCYDAYRLSVAAVVTNVAGNAPRARQLLQRAVDLAPESSSYHRQLGLMLSQGIDSAAARRHFEKAVALTPSDVDAWLLLYQLLISLGDVPAAERALTSGLGNCPDSSSLHMERARRWTANGRHAEAIIEFREASRLNPGDAQPLVELASSYFAVNRGPDALAALHEALRKQPAHPLALATLTFYSISTGDEHGALGWWEQVRRQPRTPIPTVAALSQAFRDRFGRSPP